MKVLPDPHGVWHHPSCRQLLMLSWRWTSAYSRQHLPILMMCMWMRVLCCRHMWRSISTASVSSARSRRGYRMVRKCLRYRSGERITLYWRRENKIPDMPRVIMQRNIFSLCGKLVGHLLVGGWLHVAVAFIKWRAYDIITGWDDKIDAAPLNTMIKERTTRVHQEDPARGRWSVDGQAFSIWVNTSSLATGMLLVYDGAVEKDACWLRPEKDS